MSLSEWRLIPEMNIKRRGACAAVLDGNVIVMGGHNSDHGTTLKSCETYQRMPDFYKLLLIIQRLHRSDGESLLEHLAGLPWDIVVHVVRFVYLPTANPWHSTISDMPTARSFACSAVLDRQLIVIGGYNGRATLKSCEMYDADQKQWCSIPDMTIKRWGACAAIFDSKLIVMGGTSNHGSATLKSCEMYDPVKRHWHSFPSMTIKRSDACAAVLDGNLIVIGGHDTKTLKSCEMYDPVKKQWCSIPDMITERSGACAAVVNGKVHVMGGDDETDTNLKSCEMYDPVQEHWCSIPDMTTERWGACAAAVDDKVIVMGGVDHTGLGLKSCELYNPMGKKRSPASVCSKGSKGHGQKRDAKKRQRERE